MTIKKKREKLMDEKNRFTKSKLRNTSHFSLLSYHVAKAQTNFYDMLSEYNAIYVK